MINKKIIFFLPTLGDGGGERVVSEITRALPASIDCIIVLFEEKIKYPYRGKIISLGVSLSQNYFYRPYAFFVRMVRFKKIIKSERPDSVISLGDSPNIINAIAGKNAIIRVDMFLSKTRKTFSRFFYKILIRIFFNRALKIIAVSNAIASDLTDNFGVKKERISTIYNPIDVDKIQELAKESLESQYQEIFKNPVIISTGRMTKQKGQWHLIRAFAAAKKETKNLKLVILGDGDLKPYFEELIVGYNLKNDVFLLGWQKNPFKFIAKAELFILPSLWEGLPMVLLEAMACGAPVISSDFRSGAREILAPDTDFNLETDKIEYAKYGILSPVCDENFYNSDQSLTKEEKTLCDVIINVLANKELLNSLKVKSKQRAENFDIKNIIKEWDFLKNI
jgi:glycosyltransferase involved in cell wall biosynthesis